MISSKRFVKLDIIYQQCEKIIRIMYQIMNLREKTFEIDYYNVYFEKNVINIKR